MTQPFTRASYLFENLLNPKKYSTTTHLKSKSKGAIAIRNTVGKSWEKPPTLL